MKYFVLSVLVLSSACSTCGNDPLHAEKSPDGKYVAIAFLRECGVPAGFSTQVSILEAPGKLLDQPGNIFVVAGKHPARVHWESDRKLIIEIPPGGEVSKKVEELRGITIEYR